MENARKTRVCCVGTYCKWNENAGVAWEPIENKKRTSVAWEPIENVKKTKVLRWNRWNTTKAHVLHKSYGETYGKRRCCIGTHAKQKHVLHGNQWKTLWKQMSCVATYRKRLKKLRCHVGTNGKRKENEGSSLKPMEYNRKTMVLRGHKWKTHWKHWFRLGTNWKHKENSSVA